MTVLNPAVLLSTFGLIGLLAVVFIETGFLVGFFLPGDSLLFTAGVIAAQAHPLIPLWVLLATIPIAAIIGDQCGYLIGRAAGPAVFNRPSAKRLGPDQLARAQGFFDRHGARTVLLARFVPVVRTITPVTAGASGMHHRTFTTYNLLGGLAWVLVVPLLGYFLGGIPFVRTHIETILIAVIVLSVLPLIVSYLRGRQRSGQMQRIERADYRTEFAEDVTS